MTYGLDLFSDAPPASMPMTASIMTMLGVLLAGSLSRIQDRASVLRIVAFALIMGLGATTASAQSITQVANYTKADFWAAANQHLVGQPDPGGTVVPGLVIPRVAPNGGAWSGYAPYCTRSSKGAGRYQIQCATSYGGTWGTTVIVIETDNNVPPIPPCEAGQTSTLNLGVGYAKTTANTDDWIEPKFHTSACASGCQATVGNVVAGSCYVAGIVGPPFPGYCEFETVTTGNACTPADEAANATLPAIPCPTGMQEGTVHGARGCYKVSDVTKETTTTQNPDGTTTTTETTTGPTGTTTTTTTCTGDGACSTKIQHIGGGAGTGAPSETDQDYDGKPDGSPEGEEEGEGACGKEGLPDCKVKVNEDGTPENVEGAQEALNGVIDGVQERLEYLGGMGWVREDLPFVWGPSFPSGSCSAIEIYGQPINICDPLSKVRLVWAFIISFMAGLYIWRSGTQAIKG